MTDSHLAAEVRKALDRLHDMPFLETHRLAARIHAEPGDRGSRGRALRRRLLDAIDALRTSGGPQGRLHELIVLRYVEALAPAQVWRRLGLSRTVYYEEQARAVAAVATVLAAGSLLPLGDGERAGATPEQRSLQPLPGPQTSFVGRDAELADLAAALHAGRLVTVTGPGGTGKTRLAEEIAATWPMSDRATDVEGRGAPADRHDTGHPSSIVAFVRLAALTVVD